MKTLPPILDYEVTHREAIDEPTETEVSPGQIIFGLIAAVVVPLFLEWLTN